jgi:hypothetical protein
LKIKWVLRQQASDWFRFKILNIQLPMHCKITKTREKIAVIKEMGDAGCFDGQIPYANGKAAHMGPLRWSVAKSSYPSLEALQKYDSHYMETETFSDSKNKF